MGYSHYDFILNHISDLMLVLDSKGKIKKISRSLENLLHIKCLDYLEKNIEFLLNHFNSNVQDLDILLSNTVEKVTFSLGNDLEKIFKFNCKIDHYKDERYIIIILNDVTKYIEFEKDNITLIESLIGAFREIKESQDKIPICSRCKKIRNDKVWFSLDELIQQHIDNIFSHGICPQCADKLYGNEKWYQKGKAMKG